jgi:hypothetical protein
MGKKKQTKQIVKENVNFNLSTKKEHVVKELDCCITKYFPNAIKEQAILASDEKGTYITTKSYVDSNILDPYKIYNRISL